MSEFGKKGKARAEREGKARAESLSLLVSYLNIPTDFRMVAHGATLYSSYQIPFSMRTKAQNA